MSIASEMLSNHLILCRLPFFFCLHLPQHQSFSLVSQLFISGGQSVRTSASTSVLPMNIQDLFPFDLHAVQGTFKSLLQHHSSKASILQHSAFSMDQLSHLYMTTEKVTALTICPFVCKVINPNIIGS